MIVANNEIDATKKSVKTTMFSRTMQMRRCVAGALPNEAQPGLHSKLMDAPKGECSH